MKNTQQSYCPQLGRKVSYSEFEDAKKIYLKSVKIPKITEDWHIHHVNQDILDEVFYYASKNGYSASKYEEGEIVPLKAIEKFKNQISERIADFIITSDEAYTFSEKEYENKLGIPSDLIGDYDEMMTKGTLFIINKYKGKNLELLDKEIKLYGNTIMSNEYRVSDKEITYKSADEYINGKK